MSKSELLPGRSHVGLEVGPGGGHVAWCPWQGLARTLVLAVLWSAAACTGHSGPRAQPCGREQPAFRVSIQTPSRRPLPADTQITLRFGGGEAQLRLDGSNDRLGAICCQALVAADGGLPAPTCETGPWAGDAQPSPSSLICDLWTSGAAEVTLSGTGYAPVTQGLTAEADACGSVTVQQHLLLVEPEAGTVAPGAGS